jgi:hypothetical protein
MISEEPKRVRRCPICNQKLSQGNPNKYCFVHVFPYAARDLDLKHEKILESMKKNTIAYNKKRKKVKKIK